MQDFQINTIYNEDCFETMTVLALTIKQHSLPTCVVNYLIFTHQITQQFMTHLWEQGQLL